MVLFADDGGATALAALCSGVGVVLGALFAGAVALIRIRGTNSRKQAQVDMKKDSVVVTELRSFIVELKAERTIDRTALMEVKTEHTKCQERVQALEDALEAAKIPFRRHE